jgi:hypothetical protein
VPAQQPVHLIAGCDDVVAPGIGRTGKVQAVAAPVAHYSALDGNIRRLGADQNSVLGSGHARQCKSLKIQHDAAGGDLDS